MKMFFIVAAMVLSAQAFAGQPAVYQIYNSDHTVVISAYKYTTGAGIQYSVVIQNVSKPKVREVFTSTEGITLLPRLSRTNFNVYNAYENGNEIVVFGLRQQGKDITYLESVGPIESLPKQCSSEGGNCF